MLSNSNRIQPEGMHGRRPASEPGDLAAREGVPLATIYDWNSKGTGPKYFKAGRHVRYRLVDVERWEQEALARARPA